jgi:hypothetical protein
MRSNRPELIKQMTDVLDEIIPAIPVDDSTYWRMYSQSRCRRAGELRDFIGGRLNRNGRDLERENKHVFYLIEDNPGKAVTNL